MLARHEGRVVLVRGAIPGERVRARIERVARDVLHGAVVDVLEPHTDRRQPLVDPACGGNTFAHITYKRQLALKAEIVADGFSRIARVTLPKPIPVAPSPERGYRMRARFHVRGGRVGFYRESTHDLCDAATSGQLQPNAIQAARAIGELLAGDEGVDEVVGIELAENIAADERAVHVELRDERTAERLAKNVEPTLTGLSWSGPADVRTRVVFGDSVRGGCAGHPPRTARAKPRRARANSNQAARPGVLSGKSLPPVRARPTRACARRGGTGH